MLEAENWAIALELRDKTLDWMAHFSIRFLEPNRERESRTVVGVTAERHILYSADKFQNR